MARVSDINLQMGRDRNHPGKEVAELSFTVSFTDREVREDLEYSIDAILMEIDEHQQDVYVFTPNGHRSTWVQWDPRANESRRSDKDDFVFRFPDRVVTPGGNRTKRISYRETLEVGNQERNNEEYRAFVMVQPEISPAYTGSNVVNINLG